MMNLNSIRLRLGVVFLTFIGFCTAVAAGGVPNEKISNLLGSHILEVLKAPDRIEVFELAPQTAGQADGLSGYLIIRKLQAPDRKKVKALLALALDDRNHVFEVQKKCKFRPKTGLRISRSSDSVDILLAMGCKQWFFQSGDTQVYGNFDPVDDDIKKLVSEIYGKK